MVDAVWRMLNQEIYNSSHLGMVVQNIGAKPCRFNDPAWTKMYVGQGLVKDYVCSSDVNHTIREFVTDAFKVAGIDGRWFINMKNEPLSERFVYVDDGIPVPDVVLVRINPQFYRPAEVETLRGDSSAIRKDLNWNPKSTFTTLVKKMVDNDLKN
jgi:GDPmannose 4,6-dehydratase